MVLRFVLLCFLYLAVSHLLGALIERMGGETHVELVFRPVGALGGAVTEFDLARAIVRGGFVLLVARLVGYHRRDSVWAAIPSPVAPYFAIKIAWRFINLPKNKYWSGDPIDTRDDFASTRR